MQTVGILIITVGVWVMYCAVAGIQPWATALAIVKNPDSAAKIIADAKQQAFDAASKDTAGGTLTGILTNNLPTVNPFSAFPISDGYLARGGEHKGIDYMMPVGTPLVAAGSGVLHNNPNGGSGGNIATIKTDAGYSLVYMHLSKFKPELEGKRVTYGQIIGFSGGAAGAPGAGDSTGPHLHFQVNDQHGNPMDPNKYFALTGADKNAANGLSNLQDPNTNPFQR